LPIEDSSSERCLLFNVLYISVPLSLCIFKGTM
jgi:hypothetical protein